MPFIYLYFMKPFTIFRTLQVPVLFTLFIFIASSCTKITQTPANPNIKKLLYKEVYSNGDTLYFGYDSKYRLVQVFGHDMNGIDKDFKFTYDDDNHLVGALNGDYRNGTATFTFKYYLPDSAKVTFQAVGAYPDNWMLSFNKSGQLVKKDVGYDAQQRGINYISYTTYSYDATGNLVTVNHSHDEGTPQIETYEYDDKKTPFNNVVGLSPLFSLILNDNEHGYPDTFIHNRVHLSYSTAPQLPGDTYTYLYDSDDYPVSAAFKSNGIGDLTIQYFYYYSH